MRAGLWIAAVSLALAGCAKAPSPAISGVTDAMIANPPAGEWLTYGRTPDEQRFSPLDARVSPLQHIRGNRSHEAEHEHDSKSQPGRVQIRRSCQRGLFMHRQLPLLAEDLDVLGRSPKHRVSLRRAPTLIERLHCPSPIYRADADGDTVLVEIKVTQHLLNG